MVAVYDKIYEYLKEQGFKPKLNITHNKCSKAVKKYMKKRDPGANTQGFRSGPNKAITAIINLAETNAETSGETLELVNALLNTTAVVGVQDARITDLNARLMALMNTVA